MRFRTTVQELTSKLSVATRAIAARSSSPVMEGVLISTCEEGLRLTCSDIALGIETIVPATVLEEGSGVLPGKLLQEIIRKQPEGELELEFSPQYQATIRCQGARTKLSGLSPAQFPALPEIGQSKTIQLPQKTLREMINRTSFAIAVDETRPILMGCLVEAEGDNLTVVALDGFRLAMRKESFSSELPSLTAVVPGKVLSEIAKILDDSDELVSLEWGKSHLMADMGGTKIVARLLDGEFIRYRQILPAEWQTRVTVDKRLLEDAMDRAALMAREGKNNLVRLHIDQGTLLITSNAELGDVREEIPIKFEGRELDIAFNVRYLIETLRAIEDEEVVLRFNTNVSPCVLCPTFGDKYLYLALPVRVFTA